MAKKRVKKEQVKKFSLKFLSSIDENSYYIGYSTNNIPMLEFKFCNEFKDMPAELKFEIAQESLEMALFRINEESK